MVEQYREDTAVELYRVIKNGFKKIDWRKLFPKEVKVDTTDLVKDLMPLKMGVVYNHITESDTERKYMGTSLSWEAAPRVILVI